MDRSREYSGILLQKAKDDYRAASVLGGAVATPDWVIGFHAQQAVEKAIKAVFSARGIKFPFTHNLAVLLDLLSEKNISCPPDEYCLSALTRYGAILRYNEDAETFDDLVVLDREWA